MKKHVYGLIAVFLFASPVAHAADSVGTISGSFNGESRSWSAVRLDEVGSTSTYDEFMPGFTSIHIQGHDNAEFAIPKSLSIDFTLRKGGGIDEPSVIYLPGSDMSDYYEAKDDAIRLELGAVEDRGDTLIVSGRVVGELVRTRRKGVKFDVDPSDAIAVDLTFSSTVFAQ